MEAVGVEVGREGGRGERRGGEGVSEW